MALTPFVFGGRIERRIAMARCFPITGPERRNIPENVRKCINGNFAVNGTP